MNIPDLISKVFSNDQFTLVQGIEKKLRSRRRSERNSIYFAIIILLGGIISQFAGNEIFVYEYYRNFADFIALLVTDPRQAISTYEPAVEPLVFWIVLLSPLVYFMFTRSRFLAKESEEPFRYTFCVSRFEEVKGTPDARFTLTGADRFNLFHHDLMERLNTRIKRLSLLKLDDLDPKKERQLPQYFDSIQDLQSKLIAHIQIGGSYAIREDKDNNWIIHVMPQVRIGSLLSPSVLAYSIKFPLEKDKKLSAEQYNQLIERVYSSVATEVYKQIELDVQEKMNLFPTARQKAVALFNEAEDFARSNTIDAFDRAIRLYRAALQHFEISQITAVTNFIIRSPLLWRLKEKAVHQKAKIQTGFIKSLLYRRIISALTGRHSNPIFEIRPLMDEMIEQLEILHGHLEVRHSKPLPSFLTFPKDSWITYKLRLLKPSESVFERSSQVLFDAYLVAAFGYFYLGGLTKTNDYLKNARAVHPKLADRNPLFLLTAGLNEPDLDESILLTRQATEIAPDFQIAQYLLAEKAEKLFKIKNEITISKVQGVVKEFDRVLSINPGNIAALAEQSYLWWLLGDLRTAKKKLEEGFELKSISSETFVGTLAYGLARIAAEEGKFNESYGLYHQGISASLETCTFYTDYPERIYSDYYGQISPEIFNRYAAFKSKVEQHYKRKIAGSEKFVEGDIKDPAGLARKFKLAKRQVDKYLRDRLIKSTSKDIFDDVDFDKPASPEFTKALVMVLNQVLESDRFYTEERFQSVMLSDECRDLIDQGPEDHQLAQLHRLILEETYPHEIIRHEAVSQRTVRAVMSHVLNDYGNACLGYYSRFADNSKLDEAIQTFNDAIAQNPENVIVYFNRHLAYSWKGRVQEAIDDINRAIEKYPNQKAIVFSMAQSIFDEPAEILQKREKLKELDKQAERFETNRPGTVQKQVPLVDDTPRQTLKRSLEEFDQAKTLLLVTIKDFSIKNSKFSTLFETSEADKDGTTFDSKLRELNRLFAKSPISAERLNENDVNSLKLLCRVLHASDKNAGRAPNAEIKSLFLHISRQFWAEDFDIDLILETDFHDVDDGLKKRRARRIRYWMNNDHVHYFSLVWLKPEYVDDYNDIAIRYWKRACAETTALQINNATYLNSLGNLYYGRGVYSHAAENYKGAADQCPEEAVYHSNLGLAYYGMREWKMACQAFKAALKLDVRNPTYYANAISSAENFGDHKGSSELLHTAMSHNSSDALFLSSLGTELYQKELWKMSAETYEAVTKIDQGNANWFNYLANSYYGLQKYKKAIENYEKAIHLNPEEAVFHSNLGGALLLDHQMPSAIDSYVKAITIDPKNAANYNRLGVAYHNNKDYTNAAKNYEKAIETDPGVATYHANLGLAYYEQQQWAKSLPPYQRAVELEPGNADLYNRVANAYFGLANYRSAADNYRKSIAIDPKVAVYHANLIAALENAYQYELADLAFDDAIKTDGNNAGFCYDLGNALDENQKWPKSLKSLKRAVDLKPKNAIYRNQLGSVYRRIGENEKAAEQFLKALELFPRNETYLNNLIAACESMNAHSHAHDYVEQALHLDPGNLLLQDTLKRIKGSVVSGDS